MTCVQRSVLRLDGHGNHAGVGAQSAHDARVDVVLAVLRYNLRSSLAQLGRLLARDKAVLQREAVSMWDSADRCSTRTVWRVDSSSTMLS